MAKDYGITASGEKADVQRGDLPRFFPSDLLPFENNYRFGTNDTDPEVRAIREAEIEEMVADLLQNGQIQPIIIHSISGNRFKVHAGDTRHQAFLRIEQRGIKWPYGRSEDTGRPRIECRVESNGDAKKTFGTSVTENLSRNNLTPVDVANAVDIATYKHHYTDTEILRDFKQLKPDGTVKDPAWLPNMRRLARLPVEIKRQIHLKQMAPAVGYILAEIPEESHAAVLAEAAGYSPEPITHPDGTVRPLMPGDLEAEGSCYMVPEDAPSVRELRDAIASHSDPEAIPNVSIETPAPTGPTLDYSESQAPPRAAGKNSKPKKVTARAVASAAKKRGLLKHKKVAHTIAGQREFWEPYARDQSLTLIGKLATANLKWLDTADNDEFHAAVVSILKGVK